MFNYTGRFYAITALLKTHISLVIPAPWVTCSFTPYVIIERLPMSAAVDEIVDRRRLRKRLTFWRVTALIAFAGVIVASLIAGGAGKTFASKSSEHIARISISGFITENQILIDLIDKARKNKKVKGVIIKMDSPGGATVGGEAIYEAVRALAKTKPTVTSVGGLAASAGYMISIGTDHIVARRSSLVGSIGVLFQYPDASKLLDIIGVRMEEIKSSPLKAEPSPFHPAEEEAKDVLRDLVKDSFGWFRDLVKERRNYSDAEVDLVATGRIFSGAQGLSNKLIDEIGGEKIARAWLSKEKGLSEKLKTLDWEPETDSFGLYSTLSSLVGLDKQTSIFAALPELASLRKVAQERIFLDGLLSVWHGTGSKPIKEGIAR